MKKKVKKPTAVDILICSLSKKTIWPPHKQEHKSRLILIVLDCGTFLPFMTILLLSYSFFLFPNFLSFPLHWRKKTKLLVADCHNYCKEIYPPYPPTSSWKKTPKSLSETIWAFFQIGCKGYKNTTEFCFCVSGSKTDLSSCSSFPLFLPWGQFFLKMKFLRE